ncbi:MAG: SpoIID/LytB domain-containing protein [Bacteroidales bacterium]|nr:SpoIID/LytB domain-containing protein [Bacteroidales bacterium]
MMKFFFLFILLIFVISGFSIHLDVRLLSQKQLNRMEITIHAGKYNLYTDKKQSLEIEKNQSVFIRKDGDSVSVTVGTSVFKSSQIHLQGSSFINVFRLVPKEANLSELLFDDDLIIKTDSTGLVLVNHVDLEHYVAGVVQSEVGIVKDQMEYYYVQAIISRTYALVNYLKHNEEGFNLCDNEHCQVYKGRNRNADISRAVAKTSGVVIVDENLQMISAAFHANCGGQTVNSEDIWTIPTSYLKAVSDSFCFNQSGATWTKKVSLKDYNSFLLTQQLSETDFVKAGKNMVLFSQPERKIVGPHRIPLKTFRTYFDLRSTFFEIVLEENKVVFVGRGYGHGVGLCQQGALEMIRKGYDYKDVIKYYYSGVQLIHYSQLKYNFMP